LRHNAANKPLGKQYNTKVTNMKLFVVIFSNNIRYGIANKLYNAQPYYGSIISINVEKHLNFVC